MKRDPLKRDAQLRELCTFLKRPYPHPDNLGLFRDINYVLTDWFYTDHPAPYPRWFVGEFEAVLSQHRELSGEFLEEVCRTLSLLHSLAPGRVVAESLIEELKERRDLSHDAQAYLRDMD